MSYRITPEDKQALINTARNLNVHPLELLSVISKETGGTFSPTIRGGDGGNYQGLIQFGPSQRKALGLDVNKANTIAAQLPYVERYLKGRGFSGRQYSTPGERVTGLYSTILAGSPQRKYWTARDSNGTTPLNATPGLMEGGHRQNAIRILGNMGGPDFKSVPATVNPSLYEQLQHSIKSGWDNFFKPVQKQIQHDVHQYQDMGHEVAQSWNKFFSPAHPAQAPTQPIAQLPENPWQNFFTPPATAEAHAPAPPTTLPAHTNTVLGDAPAPPVPQPTPLPPAPPVPARTQTPIPNFSQPATQGLPPYAGAGNENLPRFNPSVPNMDVLTNAIQASANHTPYVAPTAQATPPIPSIVPQQTYNPAPIKWEPAKPVTPEGGLGNLGDFFNSATNAATADITAQPEAGNFAAGAGRFVGGILPPIAAGIVGGALTGGVGAIPATIGVAGLQGAGASLRQNERNREPLNIPRAAIEGVGTGALQSIAPGEGNLALRMIKQGLLGGALGGATTAGSELASGQKLNPGEIGKGALTAGLMTAGGPVVHRLLTGKPGVVPESSGPIGVVKGWKNNDIGSVKGFEPPRTQVAGKVVTNEPIQPKSAQESAQVLESNIKPVELAIRQHQQLQTDHATAQQAVMDRTGAKDPLEAQRILGHEVIQSEKLADQYLSEADQHPPGSPEQHQVYKAASDYLSKADADKKLLQNLKDASELVDMSAPEVGAKMDAMTTPRSELPAPVEPSRNIMDHLPPEGAVMPEVKGNLTDASLPKPNGSTPRVSNINDQQGPMDSMRTETVPTVTNEPSQTPERGAGIPYHIQDIEQPSVTNEPLPQRNQTVQTTTGEIGRVQSVTPERINIRTPQGETKSFAPNDVSQFIKKTPTPENVNPDTNLGESRAIAQAPRGGEVFHQGRTAEEVKAAAENLANAVEAKGGQLVSIDEARNFMKETGRPGAEHLNNFVEAGKNGQTLDMSYNALKTGRVGENQRNITPFALEKRAITPGTEFKNLEKELGSREAVRDNVIQRLRQYGQPVNAGEVGTTPASIKRLITRLNDASGGKELTHIYMHSHNVGETTVNTGKSERGYRLDTINKSTITGEKGAIPEASQYGNEIKGSYEAVTNAAKDFNAKLDTVDPKLLPPELRTALKQAIKGDITKDTVKNLRAKLANVAEEVCKIMGLH